MQRHVAGIQGIGQGRAGRTRWAANMALLAFLVDVSEGIRKMQTAPLRLRGGWMAANRRQPAGLGDSSIETVSEVTGMVSTIFFSSSGGADDDMELPQVFPVSDIASQSLDRDCHEFAADPNLPPLQREWDPALPQTGRQYLRHVRREAAQNYIPARPLITKQLVDPRDYIPVELRDSSGDSEEAGTQPASRRGDERAEAAAVLEAGRADMEASGAGKMKPISRGDAPEVAMSGVDDLEAGGRVGDRWEGERKLSSIASAHEGSGLDAAEVRMGLSPGTQELRVGRACGAGTASYGETEYGTDMLNFEDVVSGQSSGQGGIVQTRGEHVAPRSGGEETPEHETAGEEGPWEGTGMHTLQGRAMEWARNYTLRFFSPPLSHASEKTNAILHLILLLPFRAACVRASMCASVLCERARLILRTRSTMSIRYLKKKKSTRELRSPPEIVYCRRWQGVKARACTRERTHTHAPPPPPPPPK